VTTDLHKPPMDDHSTSPRTRISGVLDWFFRDRRTGKIVIAHVPNLPILLWAATVVGRWFVEPGTDAHTALEWAGSVTLGWWAIDELVRGVNPWRRVLGLGGVIVVVVGVLGRLT
jgi:hypothetical protein